MSEPNRLRDQAVPNVVRTGAATPPAAHADGAGSARAARPARPIGPVGRPSGPPAGSARSRPVVRAGLVLAALGVTLFFVDDLTAEEAGIGLICVGAGIALITAVRRSILDDVEGARRSKTAAAAAILAMPHTAVFGLAGIGLIAFGLLVLAVAFRAV